MRLTLMTHVVVLAAVLLSGPSAWAQADAITRTKLQELEAPDPGHVVQIYLVTIAPQATVARHVHPGVEMGYLVGGSGTLTVQGEPEQLVVTYVVEKGKPLSTPAP